MASNICVKVVGFSETERHSLNTLFRLSEGGGLTYALWTPEALVPPDVSLIDVDSREAGAEFSTPDFDATHKRICVGRQTVESAWRSFQRPVDWGALVDVLDTVFVSGGGTDHLVDFEMTMPVKTEAAPQTKMCLLVGFSGENGMYLRARLALAGLYVVDDAESILQAHVKVHQQQYALVIVDLGSNDTGSWGFVQALTDWTSPHRAVVVATTTPSRRVVELAEQYGCTGILDIPFAPQRVMSLLQRIMRIAP